MPSGASARRHEGEDGEEDDAAPTTQESVVTSAGRGARAAGRAAISTSPTTSPSLSTGAASETEPSGSRSTSISSFARAALLAVRLDGGAQPLPAVVERLLLALQAPRGRVLAGVRGVGRGLEARSRRRGRRASRRPAGCAFANSATTGRTASPLARPGDERRSARAGRRRRDGPRRSGPSRRARRSGAGGRRRRRGACRASEAGPEPEPVRGSFASSSGRSLTLLLPQAGDVLHDLLLRLVHAPPSASPTSCTIGVHRRGGRRPDHRHLRRGWASGPRPRPACGRP